jgi:hypothetical protein
VKKIGILYICTGEYWKFWEQFYQSSERYFLSDSDVYYFIFTDNADLLKIKNSNIFPIYQNKIKWPYPTLLRYELFYNNRSYFNDIDYLVFCNANLLFSKEIGFSELFLDRPMFATLHPGYINKAVENFPDEKNVKSLAYIKRNQDSIYVCGGFNGGQKDSFVQMIRKLSVNINIDLKSDLIALWHDESHLNNYVEKYRELFLVKSSDFCKPEECKNKDTFITVQNKNHLISLKHKGLGYSIRNFFVKIYKKFKV